MKHPFPPFYAIEQSIEKVTADMSAQEVRIRHVEFVTSSEEWDDSLGILVCFEKDGDLEKCRASGVIAEIEHRFTHYIESAKALYGFSKMPKIVFQFDSHQNVMENYEGNYFFRLRAF